MKNDDTYNAVDGRARTGGYSKKNNEILMNFECKTGRGEEINSSKHLLEKKNV